MPGRSVDMFVPAGPRRCPLQAGPGEVHLQGKYFINHRQDNGDSTYPPSNLLFDGCQLRLAAMAPWSYHMALWSYGPMALGPLVLVLRGATYYCVKHAPIRVGPAAISTQRTSPCLMGEALPHMGSTDKREMFETKERLGCGTGFK
ncbi:unnamed protein product [Boreogadus saida]